jgi:hypothetical protein
VNEIAFGGLQELLRRGEERESKNSNISQGVIKQISGKIVL